jgi:hypothetical protein
MSKQQTTVDWLIEKLPTINKYDPYYEEIIQKAKAMEKEQLLDMGNQFAIMGEDSPEQYYNKTYVSKESDNHIVDSNKMIELSNASWESCDGCTEQDEIMYKNGYVKGYNAAVSELPKEISDEEIIKLANEYILYNDYERHWIIEGMKLYKKQLKNK